MVTFFYMKLLIQFYIQVSMENGGGGAWGGTVSKKHSQHFQKVYTKNRK